MPAMPAIAKVGLIGSGVCNWVEDAALPTIVGKQR
jgi:hypothetical protein